MQDLEKFKNEMNLSGKNVYVGHRYGPVLDDTGWDNTKEYEPLTIIQYQGDSYVSRTWVPKDVDILNKDYWYSIGVYNAQIASYRKRVEEVEGKIQTLTDEVSKASEDVIRIQDDLDSRGVNVIRFSDEVVDNDWTAAIQKTLDTYGHAFVKGEIPVNGTIEVKSNQILEIGNNSRIYKPESATNTEPVVWIKSNYGVLRGYNKHSSYVITQKPSPNGVVALGYKNMFDTEGKNVLYGTIEKIAISGYKNGGDENGTPSVVLAMVNPQVGGLASYFHSIHQIYLQNGNVGLLLDGWANGSIMNDIQLYQVGNEKWLNGAGILVRNSDNKEPLDNIITDVFHHKSNNADTLVFDGGGSYNSFDNIVSEQGGTEARWVVERNTIVGKAEVNKISGVANVAGGVGVNEDFYDNNVVLSNRRLSSRLGTFTNLSSKTLATKTVSYGDDLNIRQGAYQLTGLTENQGYQTLEMGRGASGQNYAYMVEINTVFYSPIASLRNVHKVIYYVSFDDTSGKITFTPISSIGNKACQVQPVVENGVIKFGVKVYNNGTGTSNSRVYIDYKISGDSRVVINETRELKDIDAATVLPIS